MFDNLISIRAGNLVDGDVYTWTAVGLTDDIVVLRAQFHTGNIADAQYVAIGQRANDQILVVFLLLIATPVFQHILEGVCALGT